MPELPEVETIKRGVTDKLIGKTIKGLDVKVPKLFIGNKEDVIGAKITGAKRIAKILIIELDNNFSIIIHLKMSGQLIYKDKNFSSGGGHFQKIYDSDPPHAYTHIIYTFDDGSHLYFNDFRKFGWHKILPSSEIMKLLGPDKFGPEPLSKEFTTQYLKTIFSKTSKAIKLVIMDQAKISGVGNIYANDGLYLAGILPSRRARELSDLEIQNLKTSLEKVIKLGIEYGGSSENTYVNLDGKKGRYMEITAIYQKKTDPKGHPVNRISLGGRGTFICEICQK